MNFENKKHTIIETKTKGKTRYIILYTPLNVFQEDIQESILCVYNEYMGEHPKQEYGPEDVDRMFHRLCRTSGWEWATMVPNLTMTIDTP